MCADSLCRAGAVLGTRGDSFLICIGVTIPLDRQLNLPRVSLIARSRDSKSHVYLSYSRNAVSLHNGLDI